MCFLCEVFDYYDDKFPKGPTRTPKSKEEASLTLNYYQDFVESILCAQELDRLMDQPDCSDPKKAKALDRAKRQAKAAGRYLSKCRRKSDSAFTSV